MEFVNRQTTVFTIRHLWPIHVGFKEKHILVTKYIASDVQTVNVWHYFSKKDNEVDDLHSCDLQDFINYLRKK